MKALKKWLREWLRDDSEEARRQAEYLRLITDGFKNRVDYLYAEVNDAARQVRQQADHAQRAIQQRAPKPLWRRYGIDQVGKDYGRIASAASTAPYRDKPVKIAVGTTRFALPQMLVFPHQVHRFVAILHIPIHPHHKLPVVDFGQTEEQARFNLGQQLAQIALHEGWTLIKPE